MNMKSIKFCSVLIVGIMIISALSLYGQDRKLERSFDATKELKFKLATSGCSITASPDDQIHVKVTYSYPEDAYRVEITERGHSVTLSEDFIEKNPRGSAEWQVQVPAHTEIKFNSGTGSLEISEVDLIIEGNSGTGSITVSKSKGEFELNSGTGSVEVVDSEGEFELNSGTGKVRASNSKGEFKANSGTGKVFGERLEFTDQAEFNSGTGSAEVIRPIGQDFELSISSGTGSAVLDLDGAPLQGYFEFSAHVRAGRIVCPVAFDGEEYYENGHSDKIHKWFQKGSENPRYQISTGTGTARLIK
jgi:hypothetical protein